MMKRLSNLKTRRVCKILSLFLMLTMSMGAYAVEDSDFEELELDKEYSLTGIYTTYYYKITPTISGTLSFLGKDSMRQYDYATGETTTGTFGYLNGLKKVTYDVEAGTTYYFAYRLESSSSSTFTASLLDANTPISVVYSSPEEGSTLDIVSSGLISLQFNIEVTLGTSTISSGSNSATVTYSYANGYYTYNVKDVVYGWLSTGAISEGDDVTLTISEVTSVANSEVTYGDNGTLTLTYKAPAMPTTLVSTKYPDTFLSYWNTGDEDGIITLTYSSDLLVDNDELLATLTYGDGNEENGVYKETDIPVTVSGNTISVDLTGKTRTPSSMLPDAETQNYSTIALKVSSIRDANGNLTYSESQGAVGSHTFSMNYKNITTNVYTEFDPESGEVLDTSCTSVELWISGASVVSYSGAKLSYTSASGNVSSTIAKADLTIEEDADYDEAIITIPLTSAAVNGINLTVELADVEFLDGLEHADVSFSATYNEFSMAWVTEAPTEAIATYAEDEVFQVSSPVASRIGYMAITFKDETEGVEDPVLRVGYMEYNSETGYWEYTNPRELEFTSGHTYSVTVSARNMASTSNANSVTYGEISYTFEGATAAYVYSPYTLESITPDPDTDTLESTEDNTFTLIFSGPVNLDQSFVNYGQGITYSFDSITAVDDDDNDGYATTWELVVPTWYMEDLDGYNLDLSIIAVDADGNRVQGNQGEDAQTYFAFSYENTIGVPDFELDPADGETVTSLSTITVSYANGIDPTWSVNEKNIKVYDASGTEVAYCSDYEVVADPNNTWGPSMAFVITLSQEITTEGTYTLNIPAGFFYLYDETGYYTYTSKETTATYTIVTDGINRITTDSEQSGDIYTISGMKVDNASKKGIYIIGGKKVVVK